MCRVLLRRTSPFVPTPVSAVVPQGTARLGCATAHASLPNIRSSPSCFHICKRAKANHLRESIEKNYTYSQTTYIPRHPRFFKVKTETRLQTHSWLEGLARCVPPTRLPRFALGMLSGLSPEASSVRSAAIRMQQESLRKYTYKKTLS